MNTSSRFVVFFVCLELSTFFSAAAANAEVLKRSPVKSVKSAQQTPESSSNWRYAHTRERGRFGISIGEQAGGPIRYNTRFPELKTTPNPTSYYHAPSYASAEIEIALKTGALFIGGLTRRDFAHKGIPTRGVPHENQTWIVEDFQFSDTGGMFGWAFGERFREMLWSADFAAIYDHGGVEVKMFREGLSDSFASRIDIDALAFRTRLHVGTISDNLFRVSAGPEIHVPLWFRVIDKSDPELRDWVAKNLELKGSAAIGLGVMSSVRF